MHVCSTKEDIHKRIQVKNYAMETRATDKTQTANPYITHRPKGSLSIQYSCLLSVNLKQKTCHVPQAKAEKDPHRANSTRICQGKKKLEKIKHNETLMHFK